MPVCLFSVFFIFSSFFLCVCVRVSARYTDIIELRALVSLLGAFGIKQLSDNLMMMVSQAAIEMKRLVTENKTELDIIRSKTHIPDQCSMAFGRLRGMNQFIGHSKVVGAILTFRHLLSEASQAVSRLPVTMIFLVIRFVFFPLFFLSIVLRRENDCPPSRARLTRTRCGR